MRILHIIPGLTVERGGPSTVLDALTRHQVRAGHAVSVLTTDQGARHGERSLQLDSRVVVLRCRVAGPDRVAYAPGLRRAAQGLLRRADVLHLHSIFTYPIHAALSEAQRASVPVILRPCGLLHQYSLKRTHLAKSLYLGWKGRTISETVAAWHYTSPNEAAESWPPGNRRQFVLGNGVDPDEFALDRNLARDRVAARWPQLAGFRYILFMARLHPKKRVDLLLNAFLAAELENFKLVVAGPDEEHLWEPLSRRLLARSTDRDRVLRLGTVVGDARRQLLAGAAAFALPSEHENFGIAALEALAAGTAVLLSPHVDLAPAAGAAGLGCTAVLQVEVWCEQLARLLSAGGELRRKADHSRRWVREKFAWANIAGELTRRYQWVINGCPAEASALPAAPVTSSVID